MRKCVAVGLMFGVSACTQPAEEEIVLSGATVIDGKGGVFDDGVVIVENRRITCVGGKADCAPSSEGAVIHDLSGRYITPGLVNAHIHFSQTGWIDGRPDGLNAPEVYPYNETMADLRAHPERWHRAYLCSGVTAVFDAGGAPWVISGPASKDTDRSDRAHARSAGLIMTYKNEFNESGFNRDDINSALIAINTEADVHESMAYLKTFNPDAVKVLLFSPPENGEALEAKLSLIGELAHEAGLPLVVHATELDAAKAAMRAGANMLVHSVWDQPVDEEFLELLTLNKVFYVPTLNVQRGWARAMASVRFQEAADVEDPNNCVDAAIMDRITHPERLTAALGRRLQPERIKEIFEKEGKRDAVMAGNLRAVRAAGGLIVVGADSGNPLTAHGPSIYREMESMQAAGMAPEEVIVAATARAAEAIGMGDDIGTLEAGKAADLIVLAQDPRADVAHFRSLTHVMRKGELRAQSELQVR